jgi:hypothetical protein
MDCSSNQLRCVVALMMALWTPMWCCCVTASECGAASRVDAAVGDSGQASSCHGSAAGAAHGSAPAKSGCGMPTDPSEGDSSCNCDCPSYQADTSTGSFDLVTVSAGTTNFLSFPLVLTASFMWPDDLHGTAHCQAIPDPRDNGGDTLRALHCLLLI